MLTALHFYLAFIIISEETAVSVIPSARSSLHLTVEISPTSSQPTLGQTIQHLPGSPLKAFPPSHLRVFPCHYCNLAIRKS